MVQTSPRKQTGQKGVNPDWAKLPKRHCDDCGKLYKPYRPLLEGERGFCSDNCRKSYHKHGGAYRKLKVEMKRMVEKEFKALRLSLIEQIRCEVTDGIALAAARFDPLRDVPAIEKRFREIVWEEIDQVMSAHREFVHNIPPVSYPAFSPRPAAQRPNR